MKPVFCAKHENLLFWRRIQWVKFNGQDASFPREQASRPIYNLWESASRMMPAQAAVPLGRLWSSQEKPTLSSETFCILGAVRPVVPPGTSKARSRLGPFQPELLLHKRIVCRRARDQVMVSASCAVFLAVHQDQCLIMRWTKATMALKQLQVQRREIPHGPSASRPKTQLFG